MSVGVVSIDYLEGAAAASVYDFLKDLAMDPTFGDGMDDHWGGELESENTFLEFEQATLMEARPHRWCVREAGDRHRKRPKGHPCQRGFRSATLTGTATSCCIW